MSFGGEDCLGAVDCEGEGLFLVLVCVCFWLGGEVGLACCHCWLGLLAIVCYCSDNNGRGCGVFCFWGLGFGLVSLTFSREGWSLGMCRVGVVVRGLLVVCSVLALNWIFLVAFVFGGAGGQCIWVTDSLYIRIYSEELIEDIDAHTTRGAGAYNACTGTLYFKIPSASLEFKNSLMGEHYREQYMETDKYPYITFKGTMQLPADWEVGRGVRVVVRGRFTIHGVARERVVEGRVWRHGDGTWSGRAVFWVKPTDYGIRQPSRFGITAADSVQVTVYFRMVTYEGGGGSSSSGGGGRRRSGQ